MKMTSAHGNHDEVPETPIADVARQLREHLGPSSPDSADAPESEFNPSPTPVKRPVKNTKKNTKKNDPKDTAKKNSPKDTSEEQRPGSRDKLQDDQGKKQDDGQRKRGQPPRSEGSGGDPTPPKKKKIIINTPSGERSDQAADTRSVLEKYARDAYDNLVWEMVEKANEIQKLKNPTHSELSVDQLTNKVKMLEDQIEELKRENEDQEQHRLNLTEYNQRLIDRLDKERQDYRKVCDDEIQQKWAELRFLIQNFCINHLKKMPRKKASPDDPEVAATIREEPRISQYILQQMMWCRISAAIFRAEGGIWCGDMAKSFYDWRKAMTAKCQADPSNGHVYGRLKSETAHEMWNILGIDTDAKKQFDEDLASELHFFSTRKNPCSGQVSTISTKALELHTLLMKSKALFLVRTSGMSPNSQSGKPERESEYINLNTPAEGESSKLLIMTPSLIKLGNADGFKGSYDKGVVVCKAHVLVY